MWHKIVRTKRLKKAWKFVVIWTNSSQTWENLNSDMKRNNKTFLNFIKLYHFRTPILISKFRSLKCLLLIIFLFGRIKQANQWFRFTNLYEERKKKGRILKIQDWSRLSSWRFRLRINLIKKYILCWTESCS